MKDPKRSKFYGQRTNQDYAKLVAKRDKRAGTPGILAMRNRAR